jgi:hypothetical protein
VTAETTLSRAAEPEVDEAARAVFLSHLGRGHGMAISLRMADLDRETGRRLADAWGWPDKAAINARWRREIVAPPAAVVEVPAPREPEPEPVAEEPALADPEPGDHPAVERARALSRALRDRDPVAVAALAGSWTALEAFEVACVAAVVAPVDLAGALEVLDLPVGEWSTETVEREAGRWDAGARDRTALAGLEERARRG